MLKTKIFFPPSIFNLAQGVWCFYATCNLLCQLRYSIAASTTVKETLLSPFQRFFFSLQRVLQYLTCSPHAAKYSHFYCKYYYFSLWLFSYHFSLPSFLAVELKQIHPSLTIQHTTLWMSAGTQRALRIAFGSCSASGAQKCTVCPPKQWLFISCISPTKQPFTFCFGSQHFTPGAVGKAALLPGTLKS